jgi:hypothetical protein
MSSHRYQYDQQAEKANVHLHWATDRNDAQKVSLEPRKRTTRWWTQNRTFVLFACCALAVGGAVGHHFVYAYLHGKKAENQAVSTPIITVPLMVI